MMKSLLSKKALLGAVALCAIILASCYRFVEVTLSTHEVEQGGNVTISATLQRDAGAGMGDGSYYWLYGVRVPADWTTDGVAAVTFTPAEGDATDYTTKVCSAYGQFLDFCYPKDGFKWIGFATTSASGVKFGNDADKAMVTVTLKAGEATGDFRLDLASGTFMFDPSYLVENGKVNLNVAFGLNNVGESNTQTGVGNVNVNGTDVPVYTPSEYILLAGTMEQAEVDRQQLAFLDTKITQPAGGERPVSPRFSNVTPDFNLNVKVTGGAGIEGVEADAAVVAVEWFTLQGVRVERPEAGNVYLRRQGGEVSKVYVK